MGLPVREKVISISLRKNETELTSKRENKILFSFFPINEGHLDFCSTNLPQASTRWVGSTFSSHCQLSSKQPRWLTSATLIIFSSEISGMLGIKLQTAGFRIKYANHCAMVCSILQKSQNEIFVRNYPWTPTVGCLRPWLERFNQEIYAEVFFSIFIFRVRWNRTNFKTAGSQKKSLAQFYQQSVELNPGRLGGKLKGCAIRQIRKF